MNLFRDHYPVACFICRTLCQFCTVLITIAVLYISKSSRQIFLFILYQNVFSILVPLPFHINFRIILSILTKISEILIRISLNLYISFGRISIITMLSPFTPLHGFRSSLIKKKKNQHCLVFITQIHVLLDLYLMSKCK